MRVHCDLFFFINNKMYYLFISSIKLLDPYKLTVTIETNTYALYNEHI